MNEITLTYYSNNRTDLNCSLVDLGLEVPRRDTAHERDVGTSYTHWKNQILRLLPTQISKKTFVYLCSGLANGI